MLLLLYLLTVLYSSFTSKQSFERAEATLEGLDEKMVDARNNNEKQTHVLLEPNGWKLVSYTGGEKPDECQDNCICLCASWKRDWLKSEVDKCNVRGVCKDYTEDLGDFEIKIDDETDIEIEFDGGKYVIATK